VKTEQFQERELELNGWPVRLTSYKLGEKFVAQADNVSPGACLARFQADTLEEAESQAISKANHLLGKTRRRVL
jgi:hypothetical protein